MTSDRPSLPREPVDIGILTVISPEFDAVRRALGNMERLLQSSPYDPTIYYQGTVYSKLCRRPYRVVLAAIVTAGNSEAAAAATQMIGFYEPRVMLLMGIAAGMRNRMRIGETVFAERIVAYEPAALVQGEDGTQQVHYAPKIWEVPTGLLQAVFHYELNPERLEELFRSIEGEFPSPPVGQEDEWRTHVVSSMTCNKQVTIASGDKLLRDPKKLQEIQQNIHRKVEAGDMEAAGFAAACERMKTPWLVIRGISDFGDTLKNDAFHGLASRAAAAVLADFIAHGLDLGEAALEEGSLPAPQSDVASRVHALASQLPVPPGTEHFQRTRGIQINLRERNLFSHRKDGFKAHQPCDVLEELEAWATSPAAPPGYALLGEYGIGKTTTLREFTRHLLKQREVRPELPPVIYVDLRDYVSEFPGSVPSIEKLLANVIERSWSSQGSALTAREVLELVREHGAIILFDGLDEKLVHLPPPRAVEFIRTLRSVLPGTGLAGRSLLPGKRRGKLLISCRSHYFRDGVDQSAMLGGAGHGAADLATFPAICLLPFTEEQIRDYLESFLGEPDRADAAFEVISSIHDLRNLAERPSLLSLLKNQIGQLEALRALGRKVNAAQVYEFVINDRLSEDTGKHQLEVSHKWLLMEELAAALWRADEQQWDGKKLEAWFDAYLGERPDIAARYTNKDHDVLKKDLCTATLVSRAAAEEQHFRFAHTSLQEYFLAAYLKRALTEGKGDRWDLPTLSREALEFLGQMLALEKQPAAALRAVEAILGGENLRAALVAFEYWMVALETGHPVPSPSRVKLAGANLEGRKIGGLSAAQPLNLRRADLSKVRLNRARLEHVELGDAQLTGLLARQALFLNVNAPRARASGSDFRGLRWRRGSLVEADLREAQLDGCQWIGVNMTEAQLPENWEHQASLVHERQSQLRRESARLALLQGHAGIVRACGWSPDGKRVVSGATDRTVKVWDAGSGECLLTLRGHEEGVRACGWSPDGKRVVSGADDRMVKIWDAVSGECLLTLRGPAGGVTACGWSPDGKRVVSGADDGMMKVWDAGSGECLLTLRGHEDLVAACGWSPDGMRVVSGATDGTVKVWDAVSGECLLTLRGHKGFVTACGWSPDGMRVVSGGTDGTVKVWDAVSGECLLTLRGPAGGVTACRWSPDGKRVVSGGGDVFSADRTVKVWDAGSGECLLTLRGQEGLVTACGWSPDGMRVVSGADDGMVKVWDAGSGQCLLMLRGPEGFVTACGWSPDGKRVVSGATDRTVKVWDAVSGECLLTLRGHAGVVRACGWSPDGKRVVSGATDGTVKVWDAVSGECLLTLRGPVGFVTACGWSPDGKRVVSGADDGMMKVWDAGSGECLLTLRGHEDLVAACGWSPDGKRVVSGANDGMMKVWDAESGQCLWSTHQLPEGQTVTVDGAHERILYASAEAWRWLGWRWMDPATGHLRILPAEMFDPLPS